MPGEVILEGLTQTAVPKPQAPAFRSQAGSRIRMEGWGVPAVPHLCPSGSQNLWEIPGGDSCGLRPRRGWAGQGGSLGCPGPEGMGTAPGEWDRHLPPPPLPSLPCQITVSGLDQDSQDRLLKCPGGRGGDWGGGGRNPFPPSPSSPSCSTAHATGPRSPCSQLFCA